MKGDCIKLADKISAHLDGELSGDELRDLMRHLEECRCCQHCLDTIRQTRKMLEHLPPPEMPANLKARLKACLKEGSK